MKGSLVAMLEGLLHLHRLGHAPARTLLFVMGHDEEVGGPNGARAVGALLAARGVRVAVVLDEGTSVLSDGLGSLVQRPVAVVGTAEKVRLYRRYPRRSAAASCWPPRTPPPLFPAAFPALRGMSGARRADGWLTHGWVCAHRGARRSR